MTCRDFRHKWDELLDAEARSMPDGTGASPSEGLDEPVLLEHAARCDDCRQLANRYRVLRQATRTWRQPPVPPADLADRILAAAETAQASAWPVYGQRVSESPWKSLVPLLTSLVAAAVLAAVLLPAISMRIRRTRDGLPANRPAVAAAEPEPDFHAVSSPTGRSDKRPAFDRALQDVTSATWDLARTTSEPAARIGRDLMDATAQAGDGPPGMRSEAADPDGTGLAVAVPSLGRFAPDSSAASAALQRVGDHLAAGVRPLSDTARHAFGFLIGPAPDRSAPRNLPPSSKGT